MPHWSAAIASLVTAGSVAVLLAPTAQSDDNNTLVPNNSRLNKGVVSAVFTMQRRAGCPNATLTVSPQLQLAAQWHTEDVLNNRNLNGDIGSDGSTPQDRARAAGFNGKVDETVVINPALAISGIELINVWYYDPRAFAVMSDCNNTLIGVWSANSLDRTVVVAVYGQPAAQ